MRPRRSSALAGRPSSKAFHEKLVGRPASAASIVSATASKEEAISLIE
jgi:hypothetical protein